MSNIKVAEWVYLKEFDLFGMVTQIDKRYVWKNGALVHIKGDAADFKFNPRTMVRHTDLVTISATFSITKHVHEYSATFDISHCEKVTVALLDAYKGKYITRLFDKLAYIGYQGFKIPDE